MKRKLINCEIDEEDINLIIESLKIRIENENDLYLIDEMEDLVKYLLCNIEK